jgi:hypothetical protein
MSVQDQIAFLSVLDAELEMSSDDYRAKKANYRHTLFEVSRRGIRKGVRDRLEKNFEGITRKQINSILKGADPAVRKLIRQTKLEIDKLTQRDPKVKLISYTPSTLKVDLPAGPNRYKQCTNAYDANYHFVAEALTESIKKVLQNIKVEDIPAARFWNLEHANLKGITETQIKEAVDLALMDQEKISEASFKAWMKTQKLDLSLIRNSSDQTMIISLRSQRANAKSGGAVGQQRRRLKEALKHALETLNRPGAKPLAELGGSDSFKELNEKTLRQKVLNSFKDETGVTVKAGKNIKKNAKNTKAMKKPKKNTNTVKGRRKIKKSRSVGGGLTAATQATYIMTELNKKLPSKVRENMQAPALENRTGRFASSVKVTDVVQTRKGFPSIGYTYQKDPYEVFEVGNKGNWATPERDPRKLIDRSIRELATEIMLGRLFTRRV